ncbi:MAG: hypothetical protein EOO39_07720 [Cytophagaceae bacterium]|nr:MAG: hypothetical protein EOO39_07720 [Cytophagaceae bacterium]
MKKVILTGAALIGFVAVSFAQNNLSTVNQTVGSNNATVNQQFIDLGRQLGVPDGGKNQSTITQTGVNASNGNNANVLQIGTNTSTATQVGYNNNAIVDQRSNAERAGAGLENVATINQGTSGANGDTHDNLANTTQKGHNNTSTTTQTGISHEAYVDQQSALTNGQATITQSGTDHLASIVQNGSSVNPGGMYGPNSAFITQSGQNQRGFVTQLTDGNNATLEQSGNNNQATVNQGTAGELPGNSGDHTALVQQFGSFDVSTITQTGTQNSAKTYQTEYDNQIVIVQSNGLNRAAMSQQDGTSNRANITQSGNNNTLMGLSDEYARQSGTNNQFISNQSGGFGTIQLGQTGTGNIANVTQSGGGTVIVPTP